MSKFYAKITMCLTTLLMLTSCGEPTQENVRINDNYTMNYIYGSYFDTYWPELTIINESKFNAVINFRYSFYVFGTKSTNSELNKSVSLYVVIGSTKWEMPYGDRMMCSTTWSNNGNLIDVSDVDFDWTVLSVTKA